jgi:hypothetical protein
VIVYDHHFNLNEWTILIELFVGLIVILLLPKRFSRKMMIIFFFCGVYSGFLFDHSLSVEPVSFYDVNDKSSYQIMDFLSYISFGPDSYLFFYIYDRFKSVSAPIYILIWAFLDIGFEWIALQVGIYHYSHGYTIFYSFPIYLVVNSCWIRFYKKFYKTSQ